MSSRTRAARNRAQPMARNGKERSEGVATVQALSANMPHVDNEGILQSSGGAGNSSTPTVEILRPQPLELGEDNDPPSPTPPSPASVSSLAFNPGGHLRCFFIGAEETVAPRLANTPPPATTAYIYNA